MPALVRTGTAALRSRATSRRSTVHLRVPAKYRHRRRIRLGIWIRRARAETGVGSLSAERIAELDALGMVWDPRAEDWQQASQPPAPTGPPTATSASRNFVTDDGFKLGSWISVRRSVSEAGTLSAERIAELDALDMVWDPLDVDGSAASPPHVHTGLPMATCAFPSSSPTTASRSEAGSAIAASQREQGRLAADRIAELDGLGMVWDALGDKWQRGIAAARAYRAANGHLRVPGSWSQTTVSRSAVDQHRRRFRRTKRLSASGSRNSTRSAWSGIRSRGLAEGYWSRPRLPAGQWPPTRPREVRQRRRFRLGSGFSPPSRFDRKGKLRWNGSPN